MLFVKKSKSRNTGANKNASYTAPQHGVYTRGKTSRPPRKVCYAESNNRKIPPTRTAAPFGFDIKSAIAIMIIKRRPRLRKRQVTSPREERRRRRGWRRRGVLRVRDARTRKRVRPFRAVGWHPNTRGTMPWHDVYVIQCSVNGRARIIILVLLLGAESAISFFFFLGYSSTEHCRLLFSFLRNDYNNNNNNNNNTEQILITPY